VRPHCARRDGTYASSVHEIWAKLRFASEIGRETVEEFSRDRGDLVAAALAFYALLSLAPLIIIAVAIAGAVLGAGPAREEVMRLLSETMGTTAATTIEGWVAQASRSSGIASVVGASLMLFAASRLAAQLRSALNQVWNVDPFQVEGFKAVVKHHLGRRLFAFLMVLAAGPLLLILVLSRAVLMALHGALFGSSPLAGIVIQVMQFVFSLGMVTLMTALVFKFVPDTRIGWRSAWIGAGLTSLLFNIGNFFVGMYLGRVSVAATYGAAGSAVVILLWLYLSAQLFLIGAEFTQVYASRVGRGLKPEEEREVARAEGQARRARERDFRMRARPTEHTPRRDVQRASSASA
jgi:membrane protein